MYTASYADMVAAVLNIKFGVGVKLTNTRYTNSGNFFINQEYGVLLSNKKVKFRPFTVKEEKLFLIASETDDPQSTITTIKQVLNKKCSAPQEKQPS